MILLLDATHLPLLFLQREDLRNCEYYMQAMAPSPSPSICAEISPSHACGEGWFCLEYYNPTLYNPTKVYL